MDTIEDRTPAYKSPIILAGCFCLVAGLVLIVWSMSGFLLLGGSMLFGVIAGVLGYQRQSVVLIMFPLIILVGAQIYLEIEIPRSLKEATEEFQSFEKLMPKLMAPESKKFD